MGGFNFDFSSLNPYITGIADRSMRAMDYNLAQLPKRDSMNDRAYAEWLNNNASKRAIAEEDSRLRTRGFEAAEALSRRQEQQAKDERFAEVMDKRAALQASKAAAREMASQHYGMYGTGAGVTRDFYTYGPYAKGGRGGGGNSGGGSVNTGGFNYGQPLPQRAPFTLGGG